MRRIEEIDVIEEIEEIERNPSTFDLSPSTFVLRPQIMIIIQNAIMKRYHILFILMLLTSVCMAQSIQVSAPSRVEAGENFRVSYKVTTQDVDDFKSGLHSTDVV